MDEAWRQVWPHQRTPVKFALLGLLLTASDYNTNSTYYLVEGFRQGFRLRLNILIDQIALDRMNNKRVVKGNNKTALGNPTSSGGQDGEGIIGQKDHWTLPGFRLSLIRHLAIGTEEEESSWQVPSDS